MYLGRQCHQQEKHSIWNHCSLCLSFSLCLEFCKISQIIISLFQSLSLRIYVLGLLYIPETANNKMKIVFGPLWPTSTGRVCLQISLTEVFSHREMFNMHYGFFAISAKFQVFKLWNKPYFNYVTARLSISLEWQNDIFLKTISSIPFDFCS